MNCRFVIFALTGMLLLLPVYSVDSFPTGVGEIGNEGCLCHGSSNANTEIVLLGLPEKFESSTNYSLQLELLNNDIQPSQDSAQGGFRIIIDSGSLTFQNDEGQFLEDGWTHQESSNQQRVWNFTWTSPDDNTTMSKFLIYGNAVNGNGYSNEDNWYMLEKYIPGEQNFDPIPNQVSAEHELEMFDKVMLVTGLLALLLICFRVIKD